MKTTTLLRYVLILCFALGTFSCNDKEEDTPSGGTPSGGAGQGYSLNDEGANITVTYPDGSTDDYGSATVFGWDGGQLLNLNYWKGFRIGLVGGEVDNTLNFRWNLPADTDWREQMAGDNDLNNLRFRLEWSDELEDYGKWVEMNRYIDPYPTNASGTVEVFLDYPSVNGPYDLFGVIDSEIWVNGEVTTITGAFWKKEM